MKHIENFKVQTQSGKCGLYNLANALRNESLLIYEDEEDYVPTGRKEVNKILRVEDYPFREESIISSFDWKSKIPKQFFKSVINSIINLDLYTIHDYPFVIFKLCVQKSKDEFGLHATTLIIYDDLLLFSDPHNKYFELLNSLDDLYKKYLYINSVESFFTDDGIIVWDAEKTELINYFNGYRKIKSIN